MAQRGRPKKVVPTLQDALQAEKAIEKVTIDHAKLLKQFEQEQQIQLEAFYKKLAKIKRLVDLSLTQIGFMDNAEKFAREHVNFHKKMEKAHQKGLMFFTWRGKRERVATYEYLSRMQEFMKELEDKYTVEGSKQEEE